MSHKSCKTCQWLKSPLPNCSSRIILTSSPTPFLEWIAYLLDIGVIQWNVSPYFFLSQYLYFSQYNFFKNFNGNICFLQWQPWSFLGSFTLSITNLKSAGMKKWLFTKMEIKNKSNWHGLISKSLVAWLLESTAANNWAEKNWPNSVFLQGETSTLRPKKSRKQCVINSMETMSLYFNIALDCWRRWKSCRVRKWSWIKVNECQNN